jgi:pyrroline-5-carboxylate reductase
MTVVSLLPTLLNSEETELDHSIILKIFSSIGRCRFLEEKHFDACTALSGSGPAFACIFLEAMADGGVMMGLPRAEALELAAQSKLLLVVGYRTRETFTCSIAFQGAARMALQPGAHPAQIKDSVTSKVSRSAGSAPRLIFLCSPGRVHHCRALGDGRW